MTEDEKDHDVITTAINKLQTLTGEDFHGYRSEVYLVIKNAIVASRKSLREEHERLREQTNLWAVKAGLADRKVEELGKEINRLRGESADEELKRIPGLVDKVRKRYDSILEAGKIIPDEKTYTIAAAEINPSPEIDELIDNLTERCQSLGEENKRLEGNLKTSQWFVTEMSKGIKELHAELAYLQGESPDAGGKSLRRSDR